MKKLLFYILIIITLVGIFSPAIEIYATDPAPTLGTCRQGTAGTPTQNVEQKNCTGEKAIWIPYYYTLAPLPCEKGTDGCVDGQLKTYDPTQNNNFSGYLNMMIKLFIGICAVLSVIMIVIGGIEYMTSELISSKEAGKERIRNAIFGLILALGAWTLLYTINPNLLDTSLKNLTTQTVNVELAADIPQATPPPGGKYADGSIPGTVLSGTSPALPSGVIVNHNGVECAKVGDKDCTSTKGLDLSVIKQIKSECPSCQLTITGGTESWLHSAGSSHKPGSSTIDLSATASLNTEIAGSVNFPKDGSTYTANGICYLAEKAGSTANTTANHWHVYKGKC